MSDVAYLQRPDGARLAYTVHNPAAAVLPGYTILCFNGGFFNMQMWQCVVGLLTDKGFRCICHDVRGSGLSSPSSRRSDGLEEQFTFDVYAADAEALLTHLGVNSAVVWGMAWGARAALVFAARHPDRTSLLALFDISIGASSSREWSMAQKMGAKLAMDKIKREGIAEPIVKDRTAISSHIDTRTAAMAMSATGKVPYDQADSFSASVLGGNGQMACLAFQTASCGIASALDRKFSNTGVGIACPTLVAVGEFDPNLLADPGGAYEVVEQLRQTAPAVQFQILEATGHASVKQRPTLCARVLEDFVEQHAKGLQRFSGLHTAAKL